MRHIAHTSTSVEIFNTDIFVGVTPLAKAKMDTLVQNCSLEIAWRGVVDRIDDWTFIIEDIFLPKQTVSGASVEIEAEDMAALRNKLIEEGVIERVTDPTAKPRKGLYFHGHSHVNMAVGPSATDEGTRKEEMESNVPYYVWMICNKRGEISCCVYIDTSVDVPGGMPSMGSGVLYRNVPWGLWAPDIVNETIKLKDEIAEKVSEKKYTYVSTVSSVPKKSWTTKKDYEEQKPLTHRLWDTDEDGVPYDAYNGLSDDDALALWDSMTPSEQAEAMADGTFQKRVEGKKTAKVSAVQTPAWSKSEGKTYSYAYDKPAPKKTAAKKTTGKQLLLNGKYVTV